MIVEDIYPGVLDIFEDYMVAEDQYTLASGTQKYAIPQRTYNSQLRKVDKRTSTSADPQEVTLINRNQKNNYSASGYVSAYYLEGDYICVVGSPSGYLDVAFYMKPSELVDSTGWRVILSVDATNKKITLTENAVTSWAIGDKIDIQDGYRTGMLRYWDLEIDSISGPDIYFTTEISGTTFGRKTPEVGDYVALAGYCGRPMCPEGLHEAIAQGVCARLAEAQGDGDILQVAEAKFQRSLVRQIRTMDRRVDQQRPLINYKSRFRRWGFTRSWRRFW